MKTTTTLLTMICTVLLLQGCGSKAVNEPGEDIQAPAVSFLSPSPGDSLTAEDLLVRMAVSDNDAVLSVTLSLNGGTPFTTLDSAPWEATLPTGDIAEGVHLLRAIATDRSGNTASTTLQLRKGSGGEQEDVVRMALVEIITSANCPPCGPANEEYHLAEQTPLFQQRVATIKYHVWWPRPTDLLWKHSQEWSRPRTEYLVDPTNGAPQGLVNGTVAGTRASNWIDAANIGIDVPAGAKIDLESTRDGNTITLTITVKGISTGDVNDLRLHTVVTESDIEYNDGNSEFIHHDVMRRMYPSAGGEPVSIANGQTAVFQRSIEIHEEWNPDNLSFVVFLQSNGGRGVLQAAKKHL